MENQNAENLEDLFEKFVSSEDAAQAAEDIRQGSDILKQYSAPEPAEELLDEIKMKIEGALTAKKENASRKVVYKIAAVAAVFFVLAAVSVKFFQDPGGKSQKVIQASIIPAILWESDDMATDDEDLVILTAEIEQLDQEITGVRFAENGTNEAEEQTKPETELIINGDFWKDQL